MLVVSHAKIYSNSFEMINPIEGGHFVSLEMNFVFVMAVFIVPFLAAMSSSRSDDVTQFVCGLVTFFFFSVFEVYSTFGML